MFHNFCRNAAHDRICRNVFCYNGSCRNDSVVSDSHALQDSRIGADPNVLTQHDGSWVSGFPLFGRKSMIERSKHYVVSNLASVAYRDSAVILKVAAGVDKHIFTYGDVLTEIRIEGWENAQRLRNFISEQFG